MKGPFDLGVISEKPIITDGNGVTTCEPFGFNSVGTSFTITSLIDGRPLASGIASDFRNLNTGGTVFNAQTLVVWLTENAGFKTAGGGSSAMESHGMVQHVFDGESPDVQIPHGLNAVPSFFSVELETPDFGDIYQAQRSVTNQNIRLISANDFPAGTMKIWWTAKI